MHPGVSDQPYYFTGRRYDPETGLFYYRNRYYSADLGRWLSPDPAGFVDGPNLYAYVGNNPWSAFDPYGLAAITSDIERAIQKDIVRAANLAEAFDYGAITDPKALGRPKHSKFQQMLEGSVYADYLVFEQSINETGQAVKRQTWTQRGVQFTKWPKGSKRPDVMLLRDSDYKKHVLAGGGFPMQGVAHKVVDLKTGAENLDPKWAREVALRLGIPLKRVNAVKPSMAVVRSLLKRGAGFVGDAISNFGKKAVPVITVVGAGVAFSEAKAAGLDDRGATIYTSIDAISPIGLPVPASVFVNEPAVMEGVNVMGSDGRLIDFVYVNDQGEVLSKSNYSNDAYPYVFSDSISSTIFDWQILYGD